MVALSSSRAFKPRSAISTSGEEWLTYRKILDARAENVRAIRYLPAKMGGSGDQGDRK